MPLVLSILTSTSTKSTRVFWVQYKIIAICPKGVGDKAQLFSYMCNHYWANRIGSGIAVNVLNWHFPPFLLLVRSEKIKSVVALPDRIRLAQMSKSKYKANAKIAANA